MLWDFSRATQGSYATGGVQQRHAPTPITLPFIRVLRPNDTGFTHIKNPMYSYQYPPDARITTAFNHRTPGVPGTPIVAHDVLNIIHALTPGAPAHTSRYPTASGGLDNTAFNACIDAFFPICKERIYKALTDNVEYFQVATSREWSGTELLTHGVPYPISSFEAHHDDFHTLIAGNRNLGTIVAGIHSGWTPNAEEAAILDRINAETAGKADNWGTMGLQATSAFEPSFYLLVCGPHSACELLTD